MKFVLFSLSLLLCVKPLHGAALDDIARQFLTTIATNGEAAGLTNGVVGITNGVNATAGHVGEFIGAYSTNQTVGTSGQYYDVTNIVLSPGDWDVSGSISYSRNNATFTSVGSALGFGTDSGNTSPLGGDIEGITVHNRFVLTSATFASFQMSFRRTFNTPTNMTVYLKGYLSTYTVGSPKHGGGIEARRMR